MLALVTAVSSALPQAGLIREAALLRRFQHRHVLLLYTSFVVGRELWMVMPYMDLGSVRGIMKRAFPQVRDCTAAYKCWARPI